MVILFNNRLLSRRARRTGPKHFLKTGDTLFILVKEVVVADYVAKDVAHYIVNKCTQEEEPVSNLQLQKILYFLQVAYSKVTGSLLFEEEFEAWPYGPVLREVYHEYSIYGGTSIHKKYVDLDNLFSPEVKSFVDEGVVSLREKYPWDLVKIAHAEGSPWSTVWRDGTGFKKVIPNQLIVNSGSSQR